MNSHQPRTQQNRWISVASAKNGEWIRLLRELGGSVVQIGRFEGRNVYASRLEPLLLGPPRSGKTHLAHVERGAEAQGMEWGR